jgi:glycosyltransferase involved in cell wall biosynthesis
LKNRRRPFWHYDKLHDVERLHALDADHITSPSAAMNKEMISVWDLDRQRLTVLPSPFVPPQPLLDVPVETHTNTVTFVGRLELRKGVLDLARAIPRIIERFPQVRFRFVGRAHQYSPEPGLDMRQYLERQLAAYGSAVEFAGRVSLDQVPDVLAKTDVCVFPSAWEAWGYVCAEAMAAARGVVGSNAGGLADLLAPDAEGKKVGLRVSPKSPKRLAKAICELLEQRELRLELGRRARQRIIEEYGADVIGPRLEECFRRAIEHRRRVGPRTRVLGLPVSTPERHAASR